MSSNQARLHDFPRSSRLGASLSPLRSLAILAGSIFLAELAAMGILYVLGISDAMVEALVDSMIMIALILPALYIFQWRPVINEIKSRDRAEAALRASETLLRKVLDTLPVGVWITDQKGTIVHGNPASLQIWGGARYVGIDQYQEYKAWWPDSGKRLEPQEWAAVRAISRGEVSLDQEVEIESFDGQRKIMLNSALPFFNEQGDVQGAIIVNQDITESRLAKQELMRTNELLERFFSSIGTSIAYMDRDFNFIRVNDTYASAAGHSPPFFIGKNHFELYPHDENHALFQRVVDTGEPFSVLEKAFEYPEYPERGVTYWDWSVQPVKKPDGTVEGVVLSLLDVTQRKQGQIQLARQNEELRALTEAERRQRELAEGLVQATIAVNTSLKFDQVLSSILEQIRKAIPFHGADIVLVQGNLLRVAGFLGFEDYPQGLPFVNKAVGFDEYQLFRQLETTHGSAIDLLAHHPIGSLRRSMDWVGSYVAVPLFIADQVAGIVNLYSADAAAFNQEAVDQLRAFAAPAASALQNARLFQAEKSARQIAETLSAAAQELTQTLDLEYVFDTLLKYIGQVVPSGTAGVTMLSDENHLAMRALRGYGRWADHKDLPAVPTGLTDSLLQHLVSHPESLTIPNTLDLQPGAPGASADQIYSWLVVPIVASDKVIGTVELGNTQSDSFSPEQVQGVEAMVGQAAVAIQNAWLFKQVSSGSERLRALAHKLVEIQEAERSSIARELHDEAGQGLSAIKLSLAKLESDPDCPGHMRQRLQELKVQADSILEALHHLALELRPIALDRLGLVAAVEQLVRTMDSDWLEVRFRAVGFDGQRIAPEQETALYRIVQEGLTNVVRHAHASSVGILLERGPGCLKLFIEDDGVGFEAGLIGKTDRLGLVGMRERAEMLGGMLSIESPADGGTSIVVEVPLGYPDSDC